MRSFIHFQLIPYFPGWVGVNLELLRSQTRERGTPSRAPVFVRLPIEVKYSLFILVRACACVIVVATIVSDFWSERVHAPAVGVAHAGGERSGHY